MTNMRYGSSTGRYGDLKKDKSVWDSRDSTGISGPLKIKNKLDKKP